MEGKIPVKIKQHKSLITTTSTAAIMLVLHDIPLTEAFKIVHATKWYRMAITQGSTQWFMPPYGVYMLICEERKLERKPGREYYNDHPEYFIARAIAKCYENMREATGWDPGYLDLHFFKD